MSEQKQSEKTKRPSNTRSKPADQIKPPDTPYAQQKTWALCKPVITPMVIVLTFAAMGFLFIVLGVLVQWANGDIHEYKLRYDNLQACSSAGPCVLEFDIATKIPKPVYVYYELTGFHQNHRQYQMSRSDNQMSGMDMKAPAGEKPGSKLAACAPKAVVEEKELNPCGLVASSMFNDFIALNPGELGAGLTMSETGIASDSYKDAYKNAADYPTNTDTYRYLYQQYPNLDADLGGKLLAEGVTNEHFKVWMRTAFGNQFRKLYGIIDADLEPGKLLFDVTSRFDVEAIKGEKALVISNAAWIGAKNPVMAGLFLGFGGVCILLSLFFYAQINANPRKAGQFPDLPPQS